MNGKDSRTTKLLACFCEIFPELADRVSTAEPNDRFSIAMEMKNGSRWILARHSEQEFLFGMNTLYDAKHPYRQKHYRYDEISHEAVRDAFESMFPALWDKTKNWSPYGSRSILISIEGKPSALVFAYYSPDKWSLGCSTVRGPYSGPLLTSMANSSWKRSHKR